MKKDEIYVANESGSCEIKGEFYVFRKGETRVRGDHPILKAVPDYFEPVDQSVSFETATAAPGEKRA